MVRKRWIDDISCLHHLMIMCNQTMWIGAEDKADDITAKHLQLFWNLKLCGVPIGADQDSCRKV